MKPFFLVTWTLQIIQFIRYLIQVDRSKQLLLLFLFFLCFLQFYNFVKWKLDLRNHKISIRSLFHLEKFVLRCPASDPVRVSWCENLLLPSKWRHIGIQRIWSGQNVRRRRHRHRRRHHRHRHRRRRHLAGCAGQHQGCCCLRSKRWDYSLIYFLNVTSLKRRRLVFADLDTI